MTRKPNPRSDDANAFFPDPEGGIPLTDEDLSEFLGESFVTSVTTGDDAEDEMSELSNPGEVGGPFIQTGGSQEFGASRSPSADSEPGEPEAFPTAVRSGLAPERHVPK
jgi:hypothetical protein